ncbi:MAG: DUF4350 domain-containing protein [Planctomycetota bacterium]|jgi:hypothetical protein
MKRASFRQRLIRNLLTMVLVAVPLVLLWWAFTGGEEEIDTVYGRRTGSSWASVNGTGVLGAMFEQRGHTVFSWRSLSPGLRRKADCIVWFPDDFAAPSYDECRWLEDWLEYRAGRTLIYVGRDFDASSSYWEKILAKAPKAQKQEITRRRDQARSNFQTALKGVTGSQQCRWFSWKDGVRRRRVGSLQGRREWTRGIKPERLEIDLNRRMAPSQYTEVVLESKGDMLASIERYKKSRLIVVANGSFLLNLPLVNHEHRKLAGQLIEEVGPPGQTVVFLESGPGGPAILEHDPAARAPSALAIFNVWPTNWILLHLAVVGILFCFSRFPIFGRPRELSPAAASDFGRHIEAMGDLLEQSGDRAYAAARLRHYRQVIGQAEPDPQPETLQPPTSQHA